MMRSVWADWTGRTAPGELLDALWPFAGLECARIADDGAQSCRYCGIIGKSLLVVAGIGIYAGQHESEQSTKREHVGTRVGFGEAYCSGEAKP